MLVLSKLENMIKKSKYTEKRVYRALKPLLAFDHKGNNQFHNNNYRQLIIIRMTKSSQFFLISFISKGSLCN